MDWCVDLGGLVWLHQALHLLRCSDESRALSLLEEEEATLHPAGTRGGRRRALPLPGKLGVPCSWTLQLGPQAGEGREPAGVWAFSQCPLLPGRVCWPSLPPGPLLSKVQAGLGNGDGGAGLPLCPSLAPPFGVWGQAGRE